MDEFGRSLTETFNAKQVWTGDWNAEYRTGRKVLSRSKTTVATGTGKAARTLTYTVVVVERARK